MTPVECLRRYWGYDAFRPLQQDIVNHVLAGNNALALLPTGGGKSLCFQVPGVLLPGITVVISPLVALMKDQADRLNRTGIPAAAIFTGMPEQEMIETFDQARSQQIKFLYVSPERLHTKLFRTRMMEIAVGLVAVDEAHCISQWGYDFRPEYLKISEWTDTLPGIPVIALTATATPRVIQDIVHHLHIKEHRLFQASFKRSNLFYHVLHENNKTGRILRICKKLNGSGIIYVRNRRRTMELAEWLNKQEITAESYHAGLPLQARDETQKRWMEGITRVIVCTNAFGMGIDKPDCRFVLHVDLPDSIESYFQEAGRAGRDGNVAHAVFLFDRADIAEALAFLEERFPPVEEVKRTYTALCNHLQIPLGSGAEQNFSFSLEELSSCFSLRPSTVFQALHILDRQGIIRFNPDAWSPSMVQMKVSPENLYDFELKNKSYEPLLKFLLRNHPGIFREAKAIREFDIARVLNLPKSQVSQMLVMLKKWQILSYNAASGAASVVLLQPRMDKNLPSFSVRSYESRKAEATERLHGMIEFLQQQDDCRSCWLLAYFGEKNSSACGNCDVCRRKKEVDIPEKEFTEISKEVFTLLQIQPFTVAELTQKISVHNDKKVLEIIRHWMDVGYIETNNHGKLSAEGNPLLE